MTFRISRLSPTVYEFKRVGRPLTITLSAHSLNEAVSCFYSTHTTNSYVDFILGG